MIRRNHRSPPTAQYVARPRSAALTHPRGSEHASGRLDLDPAHHRTTKALASVAFAKWIEMRSFSTPRIPDGVMATLGAATSSSQTMICEWRRPRPPSGPDADREAPHGRRDFRLSHSGCRECRSASRRSNSPAELDRHCAGSNKRASIVSGVAAINFVARQPDQTEDHLSRSGIRERRLP
jgi:hypothetical protein